MRMTARVRSLLVAMTGIALFSLGLYAGAINAAPAARPFLKPDDQWDQTTASVETFYYPSMRNVAPLDSKAPLVCHKLQDEFTRGGRVPANPCSMPLPRDDAAFVRPVWTNLDPMAHLDLVKSWAFWQFWAIRSPGSTLENSPDPQVREFIRLMSERGRRPNMRDPTEPFRDPPVDVSEFIEAGWNIYGERVLAMINRGDFQVQVTTLDYNSDRRPDHLYRMTRLAFGFNREPMEGRPTVQACSRSLPSDLRFAAGLYVSEKADDRLHRSSIARGRLQPYDVFFFDGELHSISRGMGDGAPDIGWISKNRPSSYLPWFDRSGGERPGRGLGLADLCQFNLKDVR